jgi:hypothetical protein
LLADDEEGFLQCRGKQLKRRMMMGGTATDEEAFKI